jgi:hypothetical protein
MSADEAIEERKIGGDVLRLLVSAQKSAGTVSVLEGLIRGVGPPLHVHDDEDLDWHMVQDGGGPGVHASGR